jgi:hypothetical protein
MAEAGSEDATMSDIPITPDESPAFLEAQAAEQRRRLHETVTELRTQVKQTVREKLDIRRYAREYVWPASAALTLVGLLLGYDTGGTVKHMVR